MRFRILPHTADMRLEVFGKSYGELLENAIAGLANVLCPEAEKKKKLGRGFEKISVQGPDKSTLLVNLLNEALTLSIINKKVYPRLKILKLSPRDVEAHLFGVKVDHFDKDLKAVSYHDAEIKETNKGLKATLVIDI